MATNSDVVLSISIDRQKFLGKGAYGTVYGGTWMGRKVAVKRIQIENVQNNKGGEEALQKLNHPNVVKLYHVESDDNFRIYALEFCQASLDQKFLDETNPKKYCGPMPPEKEVFRQLAKGLTHIHQNRLIHRDLKPENVLIWVDSTGEKVLMKWADFGLSKQVNESGSHSISEVRGTRNWLSPEILTIMKKGNVGKTTSPDIRPRGNVKSDVFSAGLVFGCYLLSGDHPFGSEYDIQLNILKNEPVNLSKIKQQHPMYAIIKEMLKYKPDERISSADVVSRLNNFNPCDKKKPYAAFLIDRPFNNQVQGRDRFKIAMMNCLRYRLRIALNLEINTENESNKDNEGTNSWDDGVYDTMLQLISEFDATGIAEIFRLLLERRAAIPLFVPESKKHYLNLLRHVTLPRIDNISLGDKSLQRVAIISCRQRDKSQTGDILKSVFNIDSLYSLDLTNSNITSETTLAEIGCGCIVTEGSVIQNVLVAHVMGDFRPLWSFLRRFADCFMIEDSTVEAESFFSSFMTEEKKKELNSEDDSLGVVTNKSMNCIWKPSFERSSSKRNEINGFTHFYMEDQLSDASKIELKSRIVESLKITSSQPNFEKNRWELHNIPILEAEGYSSLGCVSAEEIESRIGRSVQNLANLKKNEFLLHKLFLQEAKHVEVKMENRLKEEIKFGEEEKINAIKIKRRSYTSQVETNKLLQLFLSFLDNHQYPCSRVLSIRMLEKELANRGEQELGPLFKKVQTLSTLYYEKLHKAADGKDLESAKKQLHDAKSNLIESALNMEHLWRELSHLYTDTEPKERSPIIQKIPQLAAQHLLDGFCLELLDGETNVIHLQWVEEVLLQLGKLVKGKGVFVLSVMGIQSSGKSTLLNTMFGIRMRISVGQCTRGVTMQLLAFEGRPEYDYILLLDTKGTRSPEYHGLAGSEKRDNQMATLSILLSDATIIVIPGENDEAVKEFLPIVLMANQDSQLAKENGGRLRTRIFFVYNRIDTKQKNKLDTIIQTLGTSLHEAFSQVQNMTGNSSNLKSESPFANFNLTSTYSSRSDVCILGNVNKQTKPPGDVPDEEYRQELIQFREHIHQRVTKIEGGQMRQMWKSRSISAFSSCIRNVWKCICSANFTFTFVTVMEHAMFNQLDFEYKKSKRKLAVIKRKLAEAYKKSLKVVKTEMIKSIEERKTSVSFNNYFNYEGKLRNEVHLAVEELNKEVNDVVYKKGQEKWQLQFQNMWDRNKKDQDFNCRLKLKNAYDRLFNFESRVEEYKKKVRQEINKFFESTNSNVSGWRENEKNQVFEEMFKKFLDEAKMEFATIDVQGEIKKVCQNSSVINKRQTEIKWTDEQIKSMDAQRSDSCLNGPLQWLIDSVAGNQEQESQEIKEAYFLDWFLLRIPPHLHRCLRKVPLSKMSTIIDSLFEDTNEFFLDWQKWQNEVITALELVSIASFARAELDNGDFWCDSPVLMRDWKLFTEAAARLSMAGLASPDVMWTHERFMQAISSIEASPALTNLLDGVEDISQLWLGLRITKRILLFDPESEIKLPELQVSDRLFDNLAELVITSVIRPRVSSGNQARRIVRQEDLYALLKSTSACRSPEELGQILGECPTTHSIVLLEENVTGAGINGHCSSCAHPLTTEEDGIQGIHLIAPSAETIESLFQDHQKFMFFFERVAELFIQQHKNNPRNIRDFLQRILSSDFRIRVSWRFLTVIVRTIFSTRSGVRIIDELLLSTRCNRLTRQLNANAHSLLLALLACADQDVENDPEEEETAQDVLQAAMMGNWTVGRIRQLALIRQQLSRSDKGVENVIEEWARWRKSQPDQTVADSLLVFILRFASKEGDDTRLCNMFRNQRIVEHLNRHKIIKDYVNSLSPLSLGFPLESAAVTANPFQERLLNGEIFGNGAFEHYRLLLDLQPDWAPFVARLAYHAFDIFEAKRINFLRVMTTNLVVSAGFLLPGIDNHPYLPSFNLEPTHWYFCSCGALNCIGDCGQPMAVSVCPNCSTALGHNHVLRPGVRHATPQDFLPPRGMHVTRTPSRTPTFAVRNCSPAVTRFAHLLNALALMVAALNPRTGPAQIATVLLTLPLAERQPVEDRRSLVRLLSNHVIIHLDLLCQLLVTCRPQLNMTDKFRIGHLLLHKLFASTNPSFLGNVANFTNGTQAREAFENGLAELLAQQVNLAEELDHIAGQANEASKAFRQSLLHNETSQWAYARRVFADRQSVQLELARNGQLRRSFPFLDLLLDDENGMRKLNALQYLGEAMRFVALVRTVLLGEITLEEANRMTIAQGLEKITEIVLQKTILLDRGRPVASRDHVMHLFDGFKQLWDRFSQLENVEKKTFVDYFECQQVDVNIRPKTVLDPTAPLILILAGSELPETTFSCQLLSHAVEAASSIALTSFIQPLCRTGSGRVRLSCSSTAALADFDESLYAHVSTEEVDRFIRDHVIDHATLPLAESFAMTAVLGSAGSTIAEDLSFETIPEFIFKEDVESGNFQAILERRSLPWQPSSIPPQLQELILADLEKNRSLAEARSILISAITHLHSNTEPLIISKVRKYYISDVLDELLRAEVLTERHMSNATLGVLNRHLRLEVRHAFGLLKAIMARMKGDDIFGGRIPEGWTTMMPEHLAQLSSQKLRADTQPGDGVLETLLQMVNIVSTSQPVPVDLSPDNSLLYAIRQIEGPEWDGIPAELKMEHLGHVLLIAESLDKK